MQRKGEKGRERETTGGGEGGHRELKVQKQRDLCESFTGGKIIIKKQTKQSATLAKMKRWTRKKEEKLNVNCRNRVWKTNLKDLRQ